MRIFATGLILFLCLSGTPVLADDTAEFSGAAVLLPEGGMMVEGRDVTLWGIDMLAGDQQCWHEDRAWDCGEQASMALRHHIAGNPVRCVMRSDDGGGKVTAQCFSKAGGKEEDIALYLVDQGWARDQDEESDGLYADNEISARRERRGIWTSRFQTAEDWKNGTQRFVQYQMAPLRTTAVAPSHLSPGDAKDKP